MQAVVGIIALIGSLVVAVPASAVSGAPVAASSASSLTEAATVDSGLVKAAAVVGFNPENIISDALFYDGNAMSAAEIQSFLDSKIGRCENGKCLNVLTASISSRDAWYSQATGDLVCSALQGGTMRVSELIYRVQVACGISAKVILVTLQKEQGLTTSSAPSDWNLRAAMGASCPDTEPCDPAYSGVGPQIVQGVRQLKIYKAGKFAKQPGVNFIGYNPNSACGGTNINIQNYATAALYNYTPYQPNAAALAAGWGLGDGCSSYGNRNFYNYYTSWFGSPTVAVTGSILNYWNAQGGAAGRLGAAIAQQTSDPVAGGGVIQRFQNGVIISAGGVVSHHMYNSLIYQHWVTWGAQGGALGWPTQAENCALRAGQCFTVYTGGILGWTASTGVQSVGGVAWAAYKAAGGPTSELGIPVAPAKWVSAAAGGGDVNALSGGTVYTSTKGSAAALTALSLIRAQYEQLGGPAGALGWPTARETCDANGCRVQFDAGLLGWTSGAGVYRLDDEIFRSYKSAGGIGGSYGVPTGPAAVPAAATGITRSGIVQNFVKGVAYRGDGSAAAIFPAGDTLLTAYVAAGGPTGRLGWPRAAQVCAAAGCLLDLDNGMIARTPSAGVQEVAPASAALVRTYGGPTKELGLPRAAAVNSTARGGGYTQAFTGGLVTHTTAGQDAFLTNASLIRAHWATWGSQSGTLGWPVAPETCTKGTCFADFTNGTLGWTAQTGVQSMTATRYAAYLKGGGRAAFGVPTGPERFAAGGSMQDFALAIAYTAPKATTLQMRNSLIHRTYQQSGGPSGRFGWPTSFESCAGGGCLTTFERGVMGWSGSAGVVAATPKAGSPTGSAQRSTSPQGTGGWVVPLSGGAAYVTPAAGLAEYYSDSVIHRKYVASGGPTGALGWPTDVERCSASSCVATFEGGQITWTAKTGAVVVPRG